jgi:energy-coupling factor transport system permease protein
MPWQIRLILALATLIIRKLVPAYRPISEQSQRAFRRLSTYLLVVALFIIVLNGLLLADQNSSRLILGLRFYDGGILFGLTVSSRLLLLALSIMLFFASTPMSDFALFLAALGLPSSLVSILLLSAHFLAELPDRINQIFWAQEARGAPVRANIFLRAKSLSTILGPLVLSSIADSVERGISLELRGFEGSVRIKKNLNPADKTLAFLLLLLTLGLCVAAYLWK